MVDTHLLASGERRSEWWTPTFLRGDSSSEAGKLSRPDKLALAGTDEVSYRYLGISANSPHSIDD